MKSLFFVSFLLLLAIPQTKSWFWDDVADFFDDVGDGIEDFAVGVVDTVGDVVDEAVKVVDTADFGSIGGIFDFVMDEGQEIVGTAAKHVADGVGIGEDVDTYISSGICTGTKKVEQMIL